MSIRMVALAALIGSLPAVAAAAPPVSLQLDATQASRGIVFVRERIPVRPGDLTLAYPKWIPGEHAPDGPLNDLAALRMSAGGASLDWRRDGLDPYLFHVSVPAGASELDVAFDVLMNAPPSDVMSSRVLAAVNWNRVLLYPDGINAHDVAFKPSIELPAGWAYATALPGAVRTGDRVDFDPTSLATLVDSPLDAGRYAKFWTLWQSGDAFVQLDAFADRPQDLEIPSELLAAYRRLPDEAFALYGSRHFVDYHALLALSDTVTSDGIEHHQSSDNRASSDFLTNPDSSLSDGDLIPHEFSHSWNGKYRRPEDLTTTNYQQPMRTDLLWVYEGMNQYLGDVLSFRTGIRDAKTASEYLAAEYADLDTEPGRITTPLIDITTGAPYYYLAHGDYPSIRRSSSDFYTEGEFVWLDADTIIRTRSHGARSLDTFLHRFTAPALTGPVVSTYTRADVERLLGEVEPYDWHAFFERRVYRPALHPPSDGLERAGWRLTYSSKPNAYVEAGGGSAGWYSYGASIGESGTVHDVRVDSPAWKAGLAPGMIVLAVDGQAFGPGVLEYAVRVARNVATPIALTVKQTGWFETLALDYHGEMRYPHLTRVEGTPDLLAAITAPHAR